MSDVVRGNTVVITQVPLTFELYDRVVGCPTYYWIKDNSLIGKRSIRIISDGIAQEVAVTCRVGEIILSVVFMHPRSLEEAVWVTSL